jgi:ABC-type lipoprotein release transport system permease subunit
MNRFSNLYTEYANAARVGWFLALRQIRRSGKGTTALIIFIMVLTFLNLVVVSGLLLGLITGSFAQFRSSYSGEVVVTTADGKNSIEKTPELLDYLKSNPKVTMYSPRYVVGARVLGTLNELPKKGEKANEATMSLAGIDPDREEATTQFSRFILKGETLTKDDTGYILIGANLIKKYSSFADANTPGLTFLEDVDVGSRVHLNLVQGSGGGKDYIIKGIVKSKVDEISTRAFVLEQEVRTLLPVNKLFYQEVAIRTDPKNALNLVSEIKTILSDSDARVQTSEQAIPSFLRNIETTMAVLGNALSSFALVVATITIFIVIFINAVTKRKFIGIMKGVGISPIAIEFSYVLQAFFYGAVGSIIGVSLTFGFLKPYFDKNPIDFPFSDGILVATPEGAAIRIAILMVVTLLAGYIPAKIIVRRNTLDAILGR